MDSNNYTECVTTSTLDVIVSDKLDAYPGSQVSLAEEDSETDCIGTSLEIKSASGDPKGLTFEAIYTWAGAVRYFYYGVASYSHKHRDEITLHSDHVEFLNPISGEFQLLDNAAISDGAYFRVTKETKNGDTIVVDMYDNEVWPEGMTVPGTGDPDNRKLFFFHSPGTDIGGDHYVIQASTIWKDPMKARE